MKDPKILYGGSCFKYRPLIPHIVNDPERILGLERHLELKNHIATCDNGCRDRLHDLLSKKLTGSL